MNFAWYGHLKNKGIALWQATLVSWGIAFFECLIMVPTNRWGSSLYSPYQLKIIQEVLTLTVFVIFAFFDFGTKPQWNHVTAFFLYFGRSGFYFYTPRKVRTLWAEYPPITAG